MSVLDEPPCLRCRTGDVPAHCFACPGENPGLEKAVDALQQLHGEYASLEQMQRDAWFIAEPLIAEELRAWVAGLDGGVAIALLHRAGELDDEDLEED